jgi:hypothetical protein
LLYGKLQEMCGECNNFLGFKYFDPVGPILPSGTIHDIICPYLKSFIRLNKYNIHAHKPHPCKAKKEFWCFVDRASFFNLVNRTNLVHNVFLICLLPFCTYFGQLCAHHQEKYSNYATPGICYSVKMTVWYAGWNPPCIPGRHLYRVTNTRCRIVAVFSPDDGHIVARNM